MSLRVDRCTTLTDGSVLTTAPVKYHVQECSRVKTDLVRSWIDVIGRDEWERPGAGILMVVQCHSDKKGGFTELLDYPSLRNQGLECVHLIRSHPPDLFSICYKAFISPIPLLSSSLLLSINHGSQVLHPARLEVCRVHRRPLSLSLHPAQGEKSSLPPPPRLPYRYILSPTPLSLS